MQTNKYYHFFGNTAYFSSTETSPLDGTVYVRLIEVQKGLVYDSAASSTGYLTSTPSSWANTMITLTAQYGAFRLTIPSTVPDGIYLMLLYASAAPSSADVPKRTAFCVISSNKLELIATI